MEIPSNKTLYVIVGVLGVVIVVLLIALLILKKPQGSSLSEVNKINNVTDPNAGKTLEELTTAPDNSSNTNDAPQTNEELQKMISAPPPKNSSGENKNKVKTENIGTEPLNIPKEEQSMSKELQDSLTAPSRE